MDVTFPWVCILTLFLKLQSMHGGTIHILLTYLFHFYYKVNPGEWAMLQETRPMR